jgi:SAM-dependent methyltransferase
MAELCPVCTSGGSVALGARAEVPILQNRLYPSQEAARQAKRGTLDMRGCRSCGFVWNSAFDPDLIVYDGDYDNDQTHSPAFSAHVEERARDVIGALPVTEPIDYLEVGCGQGGFVELVADMAGDRLRSAAGFDPAWRGEDGGMLGRARMFRCYFDAETSRRLDHAPNLVASRHTIEHVPDPVDFLKAIRAALGEASGARIFIETPSISWIIENQAMQDFFYEHCSIFSPQALAAALQLAGFGEENVKTIFGGQYLWAEAVASTPVDRGSLSFKADGALADMESLRSRFVAHWREQLDEALKAGPVALWGAGAKGVTFALMIDPEGERIDHIIDVNPGKQNLHVACTGLKVLSPAGAAGRRPATIFVMNPNYMDEIRSMAGACGIAARLVPIN